MIWSHVTGQKHSGSNQDYEETFIGPAATFERKGHTGLITAFDSPAACDRTTETDVVPIETLQILSENKIKYVETWSHRVRTRIL